VSEQAKAIRTRKMIRERTLGYRVELANPTPSGA
jgi:hypothetical protein